MTGAIILKHAVINFFRWIIANDLFKIVKIVNLVHDEICIEYPKSMPHIADKLIYYMEEASAFYCKRLPVPAEASIGDHWIH